MDITALPAAEGGQDVEGTAVLLPASYDILWSSVVFVVLFLLFWRFVLPALQRILDERSEGIERKLEQAEADRAEAQALLEQYREQLAEARSEAARIRAEAQSDRQSIVAEARTEAERAASVVNERAATQMAGEAASVRAALSRDLGRLATDLAERIIGESLDPQRTTATVDRFIADLEAAGAGSPDGPVSR
ncbi:MAG TPA: F0F1 ATP synthase subunit B [Jiangellales bacterium]|nr:F0F1 ATP synthase subunit B [Jiangellales bacterium]